MIRSQVAGAGIINRIDDVTNYLDGSGDFNCVIKCNYESLSSSPCFPMRSTGVQSLGLLLITS